MRHECECQHNARNIHYQDIIPLNGRDDFSTIFGNPNASSESNEYKKYQARLELERNVQNAISLLAHDIYNNEIFLTKNKWEEEMNSIAIKLDEINNTLQEHSGILRNIADSIANIYPEEVKLFIKQEKMTDEGPEELQYDGEERELKDGDYVYLYKYFSNEVLSPIRATIRWSGKVTNPTVKISGYIYPEDTTEGTELIETDITDNFSIEINQESKLIYIILTGNAEITGSKFTFEGMSNNIDINKEFICHIYEYVTHEENASNENVGGGA